MADALATFAAGFAQRADSVHIQCGRTADLRRFRQVEEKRRRSRATSAASHWCSVSRRFESRFGGGLPTLQHESVRSVDSHDVRIAELFVAS